MRAVDALDSIGIHIDYLDSMVEDDSIPSNDTLNEMPLDYTAMLENRKFPPE